MNFIISHNAVRKGAYLKLEEFGRDYAFENYLREVDKFPDDVSYFPYKLWKIYAPPFFGKSTLARSSHFIYDTDDENEVGKNGFLFSNLLSDIDFDVFFVPTNKRKFLRFKQIVKKFGWNEVADNAFCRLCLVNLGYSVLSQLEHIKKDVQFVVFNDKSSIKMIDNILLCKDVLFFNVRKVDDTVRIFDNIEKSMPSMINSKDMLTNEDFKGYKMKDTDNLKDTI